MRKVVDVKKLKEEKKSKEIRELEEKVLETQLALAEVVNMVMV